MATLVQITPITHPKCTHMATWREGTAANGKLKRQRKYFASKKAADAFKRVKEVELIRGSLGQGAATSEEMQAIYFARKTIGSDKLRMAIEAFAARQAAVASAKTIAAIVDRRLAAVKAAQRSSRHISDLKGRLLPFKERFGDLLESEMTPEMLAEWLLTQRVSDATRIIYRRRISALFSWALKRKLATHNPAVHVELPTPPYKPSGILTPEECHELLSKVPGELLPAYAISLFSGVRRAEIERLTWGNVRLEQGFIEVFSKKSNALSRRLVQIEAALAAFLALTLGIDGKTTDLAELERRRPRKILRGGLQDAWRGFQRSKPIGRVWPHNALRHSFCSYHLAHFRDAAKTALEMGHRTTDMVFEHYREVVTPQDATGFWDVRPAPHLERTEFLSEGHNWLNLPPLEGGTRHKQPRHH